MGAVEEGVLQGAYWLTRSVLEDERLELLSPAQPERMSGIVSLRRHDLDAAGHAALYRYLMESGVICALRGGGIRFSPHFYTPMNQLEEALDRVVCFHPAA